MMERQPKLALLTNPLSGYNRRHGDAVTALAMEAEITIREATNPGEIEKALRELAEGEPDLLIVNGGDGTVRLVVDLLRKTKIFEQEPILALLQGGSTNMIQKDAGLPGKPASALSRLLIAVRDGVPEHCIRQRAPFLIRRESDDLEEYGFFWSAGALPRVLQFAQEGYAQGRPRGPLGEFAALLGVLRPLFFGDPAKDSRLYPESIGWTSTDVGLDAAEMDSQRLFVFITTLDDLVLGFSPGSQGTGLKLVALNYPYARRNLLAYLLSLGRVPVPKRDGFEAEGAEELVVRVAGDWALDGEFFKGNPDDPLIRVKAAAPFRFLTC